MGVNGIYGLSGSGLDIESMVKVGMMGQQKQLDKLQQKTDLATWKKESMSSVYNDLSTYNYSTLTQYKLQSNMNAMSATSSDESVVKVTANGSAASMTHKVSVGGLSSNAYLISAGQITRANTSASKSIYLSDSLFSTGNAKTGEGTIYTIGGKDYVGVPQSAGVSTEYSLESPVYVLNGKEYSNFEQAGSVTEYHFSDGGNTGLNLRKTVGANGVATYEKQTTYKGNPQGGYTVYTSSGDIAKLEKLINGESSEELSGGHYWGNPTVISAKTMYSFTSGDTTETFAFTNLDKSNPNTTAYNKKYTDANGAEHTLDVAQINHDFSNLARNSEEHALTLRVSEDKDGNVTYKKKDGSNWVDLNDSDKAAAERLLDVNNPSSKEKIGDWYYINPTPTGEVTDYVFTGIDGTKDTFSFTALDPANPDTTAYSKTYKDANGATHTVEADQIEHDFSNFVNNDKFISNGKIVSDDDVAVSFTVMDGSEDTSKMTEEEKAEFKKSRTITYTYGQLSSGGKTYNDLAADINALGTNIKASYDAANDSFSMTNKNSGKDNTISLTMNTELAADLFNRMGLKQSKDGALLGQKTGENTYSDTTYQFTSGGETTLAGDSGSITIDGKTYDNVEDNRITVDGVTYQLQNVSAAGESGKTYNFTGKDADGKAITGSLTEASGAAKTVNVVINQNTDAIIDKVKGFVEDYNKLLDGLYEKYSEAKYSDYKPLTESQRDKMTEKQIEKWEEKAKSGLLYHDRTIGSIIDKLRTALATPVDGLDSKYNSAYSIGIYTSKTNGHISLDEDRLKKALAEDPEAAYNVFGTLPNEDRLKASISNEKGEYDKSRLSQMMYDGMGVAQRLGDVMSQAMKSVKTEAGSTSELSDGSNLGNKILEFQQKMSDFKTLMSAFESRLFKKYDAMESLLATLGAQMNYITGGQ